MTKNIFQVIGYALIALLVIDFLGFTAWILSGQFPTDGYYVGTITAHVLRLVL